MEARAVRFTLALGGAKTQGIHEVEIILARGSRARRRVEEEERTLGAQLATKQRTMGIFAQQRTMAVIGRCHDIHWRFEGTGVVGIGRGLLLLLLLQTQAVEVFPRARVLQRLGFVQESVPCRPHLHLRQKGIPFSTNQ